MADDLISFKITGLDKLENKIDAARTVIKDLRPLWEQLASDLYKTEKQIFQLKSPGGYPDLKDSTKKQKQRIHGFTYPILFATGEMAASLLSPNARGSIYAVKPLFMRVGTSIRHAEYHMFGTTRMPRRMLWDEREDSPMIRRWLKIADKYLEKAVQGAFDGKGGSRSQSLEGN